MRSERKTSWSTLFVGPDGRPRLGWRVFLTLLGFFVAALGGSMVVVLLLDRVLGLPKQVWTFGAMIGVSATALLIAHGLRRFVDRRPWSGIGLTFDRATVGRLLVGIVAGAVVMIIANLLYLACGIATWSGTPPLHLLPLAAVAVLLGQAFPEELLFRGYLFTTFDESCRRWTTVLVTSAVFGSFHILSQGGTSGLGEQLVYVLKAAALGVACAACLVVGRSLWIAVGFHTGHNVIGGALTKTVPGHYGLELLVGALVLVTAGLLALWLGRSAGDRSSVPGAIQ